MSTPRKRLPVKPSAEHLRKQAKRRHKLAPEKPLSEHQHALAYEYGCKSWAQLMHMVETMLRGSDQLSNVKYEWEALPKAAKERDEARIREILASGEFTQHDLDVALVQTVIPAPHLAELLIEHGADVDGQYGSDYGPIVLVYGECQEPDGFQFMADHGCDLTFSPLSSKYGPASPMLSVLKTYMRARNEKKHRCIQLLEQHGAWMPPADQVTPAMWAIHKGDAQVLARFIDQDRSLLTRTFPQMDYGNIGLAGGTLLHMAAEYAEMECLDVLIDRGADINIRAEVIDGVGGHTPIFHAAQNYPYWKTDALPYLVKRVGEWLDTSIRATVKQHGKVVGQVSVMELFKDEKEVMALLEPLDIKTRLKEALRKGDTTAAQALLAAHPESLGADLWPAAIFQGKNLASTKLLAQAGLSVDECTAPRKPLHLAVYQYATELVDYLLEAGADPNQRNPLGETPLELLNVYDPRPINDPAVLAIRERLLSTGAEESIFSLIRSGSLGALKDAIADQPALLQQRVPVDDLCPLSVACVAGRLEVVNALLAEGCPADAPNRLGNTPLWFAVGGFASAEVISQIAQRLLSAGAQPNAPCEEGATPLSRAESLGLAQLAKQLQTA
ncbi:ankyrin repeat domain-containing protein [Cerasicoccus fimbriatus]|uniref:ankyrin repeat domain-containing protein n=1 Tax=Cerasicoccus fimbriatus TaxID=3014554 RepID=UPI0022B3C0E0|nr:ankyrin repeat domain-containing protein [Cerasicoccus sp. TK19100]